jgi:predicted AlkP superfamily phosphohydrolase/phosphomutase
MLVWKVLRKPKFGYESVCEDILKEIYIHELDIHSHNNMGYEQDSYLYEIIENKKNRINNLEKKYNELSEELDCDYFDIQIVSSDNLNHLYVVYKPETFIHYPNEWLHYWGSKGYSIKCINI